MGVTDKIVTLEGLLAQRARWRAGAVRVVHCHGCFDIVHPGHIRHLRQARSLGGALVVTITGDAGYTKRGGTPLIPEALRAENLAELDCVDRVCVVEAPTAEDLLRRLAPDVYVKGREYETNNDPRFAAERRAVEAGGGRVVFTSGDVVFSSTALIAALEQRVDPFHARLGQLLGRSELQGPTLHRVLAGARGKRVLVIGETILDEYVLCDQPEVASESPVLTLRPLETRGYDGGAAIIARHVAALGGRPVLLTGLGEDEPARALARRLEAEGVAVESVPVERPLAVKRRFLVGTQKVMKLNALETVELSAQGRDELVRRASALADECDGCIIADFGNGLLGGPVVERLCRGVRDRVGVLTGDVSGRRGGLTQFREADLLTPSEREAREALRKFDESIPAVAWSLLEATRSRAALLTLGGDGLIAFDRLEEPVGGADSFASRVRGEHVPALCAHAVDPLGCGDALLAAATMALCAGAGLLPAALLGALAAAAQAQRLGNVPVSAEAVRDGLIRLHTGRLSITPVEAIAPALTATA